MKKLLFIIIILISLLITGCDLIHQNEYFHLKELQRSLLTTGDQLVYEDCNLKMDTFSVNKKISGTYKSPLTGSNCGEPARYIDLELLSLVNKEELSDNYCGHLRGTKFGACENDYYCDKSILFVLFAPASGFDNQPRLIWYGRGHQHNAIISSLTVLDKKYDNVYYFESSFIHKGDSIKGIYYSCQYGIIQMDLMDGNVLKLVR